VAFQDSVRQRPVKGEASPQWRKQVAQEVNRDVDAQNLVADSGMLTEPKGWLHRQSVKHEGREQRPPDVRLATFLWFLAHGVILAGAGSFSSNGGRVAIYADRMKRVIALEEPELRPRLSPFSFDDRLAPLFEGRDARQSAALLSAKRPSANSWPSRALHKKGDRPRTRGSSSAALLDR
jgi:hypothetical protein